MKIQAVYSITHTASGRSYIGSSAHAIKRMNWHRRALRAGTHPNPHLQHAWNLYSEDAFVFEIEEIVKDPTRLTKREQAHIDVGNTTNSEHGFNIAPVTDSTLGVKFSEESKERLKQIWAKRKTDPKWKPSFTGRKHTGATRKQISETKANATADEREAARSKMRESSAARWARGGVSPETSAKMSETRKGKPWTAARRAAQKHARKRPPVSAETRAKISASKTGVKRSEESREKQSLTTRGRTWSAARLEAQAKILPRSAESRARSAAAAKARWAREHAPQENA